MFFHLLQKFNLLAKMAGKCFLSREADDYAYTQGVGGQKFCQNRSILYHLKINASLALYAEIQDDRPKWQEINFSKKCHITLHIPWG